MKKILLLLMFMTALMPALAQTKGKVTDKDDGLGITSVAMKTVISSFLRIPASI